MKKTVRKILSALLVVLMIISAASFVDMGVDSFFSSTASALDVSSYSVGDIIEFGNYPQSFVDDLSLTSKLDTIEKNWISYEYYSGDRNVNSAMPHDYMFYADINYYGTRFRAVRIKKYRPFFTYESPEADYSFQDENGYFCSEEKIYYFRYEPLKWRVLDPTEGLLLCEYIIDAQAYNDATYFTGNDYLNSVSGSYYACEWEGSSLRDWMNSTFLNTAFDSAEQTALFPRQVRDYSLNGSYDGHLTADRVFLLKQKELNNGLYNLETQDSRIAYCTDYAKCQGLVPNETGTYEWRLRTATEDTYYNCFVKYNGYISLDGIEADYTGYGIRPAIVIQVDCEPETFEFGSYPQSEVKDARTLESLRAIINTGTVGWKSYGYYYGTATYQTQLAPFVNPEGVTSATQSDYMQYADFIFNGEKYRAVTFSQYRPVATYLQSRNTNSNQLGNGYSVYNIYFFKFEPLIWRVLDSSAGLVLCENIIDSQPMYNRVYAGSDGCYYGNAALSYPANKYSESYLRTWLNDDFLNTAFNPLEQSHISVSEIDNSSTEQLLNDTNTFDKVFILSENDALNAGYSFTEDESRMAFASDYAKCQGVSVPVSTACSSEWRLRTAKDFGRSNQFVLYNGAINQINVCCTDIGIRPAIVLNLEVSVGIIRNGVNVSGRTITVFKNTSTTLTGYNTGFASPMTENWISSDSTVATVNNNGVVTALSSGNTVISYTVSDSSNNAMTTVTVRVREIFVSPIYPIERISVEYDSFNLRMLVGGISPGTPVQQIEEMIMKSEAVNTVIPSGKKIAGTGTEIIVETDKGVYESIETVLFGDVNGDGWYDGTDAMIVNCIANGLLSESDVGEAVYMAADCNHDGVIDSLDVDILNQAGVLLADVDQTKSEEELIATSSAYVEYLNLIDQTVEAETTEVVEEEPTVPEIEPARPEPLIFRIVNAIALVFWSIVNFFTNLFD